MPPTVDVLWFYGADAVGKSTIGWEAYSQLVDHGVPTAYVDTDSLAFCTPQLDDPARLIELNLGAVWPHFAEAGARCLVVSGIMVTPADRARFMAAIPDARLTVVRLDARAETLRDRIVARRQAEAVTRGTELSGETLIELSAYADRSAAFAELLRTGDVADLVLGTDDQSPAALAETALSHGHWPAIVALGSDWPSTTEPAR